MLPYPPRSTPPSYQNICSFLVFQETLLLAVPNNDPLAKKDSVCLQDLNGRNILRLKTCELYLDHIFDSLCKKKRIKTNFIWQNDYVIFNGLWNNPQYSFLTSTLHNNLEYHNHIRRFFSIRQHLCRYLSGPGRKNFRIDITI